MRAAVVTAPGATPAAGTFAEPEAGPGVQLVEIVAAGIHPVVRGLASGRHYGSTDTWPKIPGVDAVARTADGGLCYTGFTADPYGTFAERAAVRLVLPVPSGADPVTLAAGMNPGMASWLPLTAYLDVPAEASVLVLGATGSAGRLAVQNCRALGVKRVLAAGRNPDALARTAELGGCATVSLAGETVAGGALGDAVAEYQPDLVLDFLWGPVAEAALTALGTRGLATVVHPVNYVEIGAAAGATAAVPAAVLRSRSVTLRGSGAGSVAHDALARAATGYAELLASGTVQVDAVAYPLDDIATAWADTNSEHRAVLVF
ncbi:MAG: zinc-binding alcohol dehydrogenase family protein [Micropruina sp.]|uniref:zinc-binding alcohol dehydrogenase family protein n=1 Tax=Micropruina sp. TaxID=2737536 RepID=UPI0039E25FC6